MSGPVPMATSRVSVVFGVCAILPIIFGSVLDKTTNGPSKGTVDQRQHFDEGIGRNAVSSLIKVPRVLASGDSETATAMTSPLLPIQPPSTARCRTVSVLCRVLSSTSIACNQSESESVSSNIIGGTRPRRIRRELVTFSDDVITPYHKIDEGESTDSTTSRDVISSFVSEEFAVNRSSSSGARSGVKRSSSTLSPSQPMVRFSRIIITPVFQADGGLSAILKFTLTTRGEPRNTTVEVHWMSKDSNVNKTYQQCQELNSYSSQRVNVLHGQNVSFTISQLMYNYRYQIELRAATEAAEKSQFFVTPGCGDSLSMKCRRCRNVPPTSTPENLVSNLLVNVSCVEKLANTSVIPISVHPTDESNRHSGTVATASTTIGVWIVWRPPDGGNDDPPSLQDVPVQNGSENDPVRPSWTSATSRWSTTVQIDDKIDKDFFVQTSETGNHMRLALKANRLYDVQVVARNKIQGKHVVVYHLLKINASEVLAAAILDESSLPAERRVRLCHHPQPEHPIVGAATGGPFGTGDDQSIAVMVGVLSLGTVCLTAMAAAFHKRCQRRIRNVFIVGKPPIMHCNSYEKSSPSGSFHLFRNGPGGHAVVSETGHPLDVLSSTGSTTVDEWEIDAREVALGVEIGQGAFGRVLTGFYRGNQVAIKVLKDHIPDSYRDDLLREIALMKGVGLHPNIVTMVGACTIRDPIALIMEYVPYGNLQSFLKKCRVDRESHRAADRDNITYCLVDELSGHKECWHITAMDVLSFARQVANAMEYLSERHFVHRDLAARNILLGYSKVVKVCDFGLARAVYTGDQYYKLTSGRLPLKWMALESIRDRVFTTCSDVWSFGILLWEIVTMGASPYPNIALADVYRLLAEGYRMQQPKNCSDELYDIMSQCWYENPVDRPSFTTVRRQLEHLLCRSVDYLDLDNIDAPLAPRSQSTVDSTCCTASGSGTGTNHVSAGITGTQLLTSAVTGLQGVGSDAVSGKKRSDLLLCGGSDEDEEDDEDIDMAMLHLDLDIC